MTIAIPRLDRSTAAERGLTIADFLVPIRVGERLNARVRDLVLVLVERGVRGPMHPDYTAPSGGAPSDATGKQLQPVRP